MNGEQVTAVTTEIVTDPAEVAVPIRDLAKRFLRAIQARAEAEQAVKAAYDAREATFTESRAVNDAFGEALAERAGLADVHDGKATVLFGRLVFNVSKQTQYGRGTVYFVEMVPAVEVAVV